jgi:hypothetical protein
LFENRVLRRIFGPKRDEMTRGWRKLHNEELHKFYLSTSIMRMIQVKEDDVDSSCSMNEGEEKCI